MAATRPFLCYLGVLLFLAMAASGAAAFGLPRGVSPAYCANEFLQYHGISQNEKAAIHLGNTKSGIAGYGGRLDPYTAYQLCIPSWFSGQNRKVIVFCHVSVKCDSFWLNTPHNGTLVGEAAINHAAVSPGTAVSGFKRLLGIRCGIQMETEEGHVMNFLPERVAGILIAELKKMAEARLGREIESALVTVPGHLNGAQRSSFRREAARLHGGFGVAKVVDEQVAAAAAYRLYDKRGDGKVVLVFHLGGRTSHATKFRFKDGTGRLLEERHDAYLRGDDFTDRVVDYFVELIKEKHHRDIQGVLMNIGPVLGQGADIYEELTRAKFEELNRDLMERALEIVDTVVMGGSPTSQTQSRKDAIDEVILVGGSVRIPMVGQLLEDYFNGRGLIRDEDAVIRGAALLSRPESARYVDECYNGGVSGPLCWQNKHTNRA
ncbi:hypothetical protein VPH35_080104 [Triticum aestivum]